MDASSTGRRRPATPPVDRRRSPRRMTVETLESRRLLAGFGARAIAPWQAV
ncbi:MAG: hypothetical protein FJ284_15240 [Planctomycetes bacterium]|nr:hypothetical protein [Planctomycetota bacterium]